MSNFSVPARGKIACKNQRRQKILCPQLLTFLSYIRILQLVAIGFLVGIVPACRRRNTHPIQPGRGWFFSSPTRFQNSGQLPARSLVFLPTNSRFFSANLYSAIIFPFRFLLFYHLSLIKSRGALDFDHRRAEYLVFVVVTGAQSLANHLFVTVAFGHYSLGEIRVKFATFTSVNFD